jgi:DNA-binding MarR family transcriptional regulator
MMEEEKLGLIIRRISNALKKDMDNHLKDIELTMSQGMVLAFLNNAPAEELTQKAVERFFGLQHPTVSGILKRLEKNGFVSCSVNNTDRRLKDIHLTDKARNVDARAKKHQAEMEQTFIKGFSPEEVSTLRALLKRVLDNLES